MILNPHTIVVHGHFGEASIGSRISLGHLSEASGVSGAGYRVLGFKARTIALNSSPGRRAQVIPECLM